MDKECSPTLPNMVAMQSLDTRLKSRIFNQSSNKKNRHEMEELYQQPDNIAYRGQ